MFEWIIRQSREINVPASELWKRITDIDVIIATLPKNKYQGIEVDGAFRLHAKGKIIGKLKGLQVPFEITEFEEFSHYRMEEKHRGFKKVEILLMLSKITEDRTKLTFEQRINGKLVPIFKPFYNSALRKELAEELDTLKMIVEGKGFFSNV